LFLALPNIRDQHDEWGNGDAALRRRMITSAPVLLELCQTMERPMRKYLVVMAGTLAVLGLALLIPNRVDAGASASAPTKNTHQASSHNYPVSEYSSSRRRH
jgi:hypothetical protein